MLKELFEGYEVSSRADLSRPWISSGMTLSSSSHQTRTMALSCMAERKGVSSRASLLISTRCLWVTLPSYGHHARAVTFNLSLCYIERKQRKKDKMQLMGLEKVHCGWRYHTPSRKAPMNETLRPLVCHEPYVHWVLTPTTSSTLHGSERDLLETLLHLGQDLPNRTPRQSSHIQAWKVA